MLSAVQVFQREVDQCGWFDPSTAYILYENIMPKYADTRSEAFFQELQAGAAKTLSKWPVVPTQYCDQDRTQLDCEWGHAIPTSTVALLQYTGVLKTQANLDAVENYFNWPTRDGGWGPHITEALSRVALLAVDPASRRKKMGQHGRSNQQHNVEDLSAERVGSHFARWLWRRFEGGLGVKLTYGCDVGEALPSSVETWLRASHPHLWNALQHLSFGDTLDTGYVKFACTPKLVGAIAIPSRVDYRLEPLGLPQAGPTPVRVWDFGTYWTVRLRGIGRRSHLKWMNRLFPAPSPIDNSHMTQHLADMVSAIYHTKRVRGKPMACDSEESPASATQARRLGAINDLLTALPIGSNQILALGCLAAYLGLPKGWQTFKANVLDTHLLCGHWRDQLERLKCMSLCLRKSSRDLFGHVVPDECVSTLAYMELLFGRSGFLTNWETEISNRCNATLNPQPASWGISQDEQGSITLSWKAEAEVTNPINQPMNSDFYGRLAGKLAMYSKALVTARATHEPLDKFWARRHEWIASGSSGGFKFNVTGVNKQVHQHVRGLKRAWAENTKFQQIEAAFNGRPVEVARASEKFENGKARAIYGVDPYHYTINTYATKGFEERLHILPGLEKGASGVRAVQLENHRAHLSADPNMECSMLDYADFNRHHTPQAQAMIFEAFANRGKEIGAHPDWIKANLWVAEGKKNMHVYMPNEKSSRRVVQGMFSGTRSTDLINTLLNLAYFQIASDYLREQMGVVADDLYSVHQGDDVWISNRSKLWARLVYYGLNSQGFLFQPSKQMFGSGRGEYLRVLYAHGVGSGYLMRAFANYILRPLQQDTDLDPQAWLRTIADGAYMLNRRGLSGSYCYAMYTNDAYYWSRARAHGLDDAPINIHPVLSWASLGEGGSGLTPAPFIDPGVSNGVQLPMIPAYKSTSRSAKFHLNTYMTDDWIDCVAKKGDALSGSFLFDAEAIRAELKEVNYTDVLDSLARDKGYSVLKADWSKYLRLHKGTIAQLKRRYGISTKWDVPALRVAHGPTDAIKALLGRGAEAELRTLASSDGAWGANFNMLSASPICRATSASTLGQTLQSAITRSRFRSDRVASRALHISRSEALLRVLGDSADTGKVSIELMSVVDGLLRAGNMQGIDLLLGASSACGGGIQSYIGNGVVQYLSQMSIELAVSRWACHPELSKATLLMPRSTYLDTISIEAVCSRTSLSQVMY